MDCRYCHNTVDKAAYAAIPATATCVKCHAGSDGNGAVPRSRFIVRVQKLLPIRESATSGRFGRLGEGARPSRLRLLQSLCSRDTRRQLRLVHGRVDKMDEVVQVAPLSMSWCLDCHRNPTPHLRPPEEVTRSPGYRKNLPKSWCPHQRSVAHSIENKLFHMPSINP